MSDTVRSTRRLACSSSRGCEGGTCESPMTCAPSRTGGGPPSATFAEKNLLTENVEQGGDATITA
eukprot:6197989-Pleurochrysis_carterae.AAC.3